MAVQLDGNTDRQVDGHEAFALPAERTGDQDRPGRILRPGPDKIGPQFSKLLRNDGAGLEERDQFVIQNFIFRCRFGDLFLWLRYPVLLRLLQRFKHLSHNWSAPFVLCI